MDRDAGALAESGLAGGGCGVSHRGTVAYTLACLTACSAPWAGHPGMGWRWKAEPTVGVSTPELAEPVQRALRSWGYGRYQATCRGKYNEIAFVRNALG